MNQTTKRVRSKPATRPVLHVEVYVDLGDICRVAGPDKAAVILQQVVDMAARSSVTVVTKGGGK